MFMRNGILTYGAQLVPAEYEFYQFKTPSDASDSSSTTSTAAYLRDNPPHTLPALTEGMFGYSLTRPVHNQDYYYDVFNTCERFRCNIEGWHTESGPGVYEAALEFGEIREMADRASLFKLAVKSIAARHGVTPCFMAKPKQGLPGNSGHMHVSIVDKSGKNMLARETRDDNAQWEDIAYLSDLGRHFLAGVLDGLPDVMPLVAPTVNSYKRLVENFWAPVTVSWGLEHRAASIRLIAPPTSKPGATRFEVRVPGADANPHFVLAAVLALGYRGIEKKLEIPCPPLGKGEDVGSESDAGVRLAKGLREATSTFMRPGSVAREVFGDDFVEHFGGTREHEIRLWEEAVTDWYVSFSPSPGGSRSSRVIIARPRTLFNFLLSDFYFCRLKLSLFSCSLSFSRVPFVQIGKLGLTCAISRRPYREMRRYIETV